MEFDTQKYSKEKTKEYLSCNHIWVYIPPIDYGIPTIFYHHEYYQRCIKCGLDESVCKLRAKVGDDWLSLDEKIMFDVISNRSRKGGLDTFLPCDFDLAKAIYTKIKETHPDIDDETALKYLRAAFYNISKNIVSDERKVSRAKRLSLKPDFNNWGRTFY